MHGYQILGELAERSGGRWRPSPGSVYPTLQQLADEGLVSSEEQDGRRVFSLTDAGRAQLAATPAGAPAPWDQFGAAAADASDEGLVRLHDLAVQVGMAVLQVANAGTPAQVATANELLAGTRRALYRLLAEDPDDPAPAGAPTTLDTTPDTTT
jgi:DNA-binding PadR family transcriptional regulator